MSNRCKLLFEFDVSALQTEIAGLEQDAWVEHFVKDNYEGAWTVLPLRAPAGATHPIATIYSDPAAETFVDTPLLERCPHFKSVLQSIECPLQAVRLMKLAAGSIVKPHRDHDLSIDHGRARLHVPVVTNAGVDFRLEGERVVLNEGECWYLDLSRTHSVANHGSSDRIHLVIDAIATPWLHDQLRRGWEVAPVVTAKAVTDVAAADAGAALDAFREAVRHDRALQDQLSSVADAASFVARVLELAGERGYTTTAEAIDRAMREGRRWARLSA